MSKVKITVLKKCYYEEFAEKYLSEGKEVGPCPLLNEGDVFMKEVQLCQKDFVHGRGLIFIEE